jgi:hypothetical protein
MSQHSSPFADEESLEWRRAAPRGLSSIDAAEGVGEPPGVHRLEQIVERVHLEGAHCVAIVGGRKDDLGYLFQSSEEVEPTAARHLHVEQEEPGPSAAIRFSASSASPASGDPVLDGVLDQR